MKLRPTLSDAAIDAEIAGLQRRKLKLVKLRRLRCEIAEMEGMGTASQVIERLATLTAAKCELRLESLFLKSREQQIADARFIVFHLARKHTTASLAAIARPFDRDHGTVLHGLKSAARLIETDPAFRARVQAIEAEFLKGNGQAAPPSPAA